MIGTFQRALLLLTGATLFAIGIIYCTDPNLLLAHYDLSIAGISDDNMYRGAYGGLFVTLGLGIGYGGYSSSFRRTATLLALLFMAGFALGRSASILALGMPHPQIIGLLVFEVVSAALFGWMLRFDSAATGHSQPKSA